MGILDSVKDIFGGLRDKTKMGTLEFYTELLFSLIKDGNIDKPGEDDVLGEGQFYYATNKIFTRDNVKKIYFINELPMYIDTEFMVDLKHDVSIYGHINEIDRISHYDFERDSWKTRNRIKIWKNRALKHEKDMSNKTEVEDTFADSDTRESEERVDRMIESWKWVNETEKNNDRFCRYNKVIELVAEDLEKLYEMERIVVKRLKSLYIRYNTIFVQTNEYYKAYSLVGNERNNLLSKMNVGNILSDRVVSKMFNTANGLIGDPEGLYMGSNVFNSSAVTFDLKKGTDAVVFLLTADTGGGKSGYSKGLFTHLKLEGIPSIDVDYEGDEYIDVGLAHGATIIDMSSSASTYFDTTEIGDLTGDPKIDETLKEDAIGTTKLVFDVLTDFKNGMNYNELSLFNDMILRVYSRRGVTEDKETWVKSKGASYEELYKELYLMREEDEYKSKIDEIDDFITKLRVYFEGNIYSGMFQNRISVNEILDAENVVFSFGMRGKTENTIDERSLALRQLFVGYLIILKCNYNKTVLGKLTAVKLEELQRYLTHEASGNIVNDIVTGGRKRGMIVFLITNSPLQFVDTLDNLTGTQVSSHAKNIKTNINGFIIGRLEDEVSERIVESFKTYLGNCLPELKLLNMESADFEHSFLLHFKGETGIVKYELPEELLWMYETRKDQEG